MKKVIERINRYLEFASECSEEGLEVSAQEWRVRAFGMEEALNIMGIETTFICGSDGMRVEIRP